MNSRGIYFCAPPGVSFKISKLNYINFYYYFILFYFIFADLLVGLVNVLIDILWRITITWHAGNWGCKLVRYLQVRFFILRYLLVEENNTMQIGETVGFNFDFVTNFPKRGRIRNLHFI